MRRALRAHELCNPTLPRKAPAELIAVDPDKRLEVYKKAEEVIQGDVGYIPVVYRLDTYALKPWLKGVPVNKQGYTVTVGNMYTKMAERVSIEGRPAE
jgi:ABC-type transport system substrate-binding protein